jgi:hypothetical protein
MIRTCSMNLLAGLSKDRKNIRLRSQGVGRYCVAKRTFPRHKSVILNSSGFSKKESSAFLEGGA